MIPDDFKKLCLTYDDEKFTNFLIMQVISLSITGVNFIIRAINIYLIGIIQYHSVSQRIKVITATIFVATFLNTAILLLFSQADLQVYSGVISWMPFKGRYPDLTETWYLNIGPSIVSAMTINSVYIYIDFGITYGTKFLFRTLDKGLCYCFRDTKFKTKRTTLQ